MKALVVGGGGREHAICWKLAQSPKVTELYCAPGNGGIAQVAQCVPIKATDVEAMVAWAKEHAMDFVMVAPDDPLALGMVDALEDAGIPAFGPRADAAIIDSLMAGAMVGEGTNYADLAIGPVLNAETGEQYGVGFRKGSDAVAALNEFFRQQWESGALQALAEQYGVQAALIEQK